MLFYNKIFINRYLYCHANFRIHLREEKGPAKLVGKYTAQMYCVERHRIQRSFFVRLVQTVYHRYYIIKELPYHTLVNYWISAAYLGCHAAVCKCILVGLSTLVGLSILECTRGEYSSSMLATLTMHPHQQHMTVLKIIQFKKLKISRKVPDAF